MTDEIIATLKTDKGEIRLRLFAEDCPYTVANFTNLAERGFYDDLNFHRVIPDFMIQGGCPEGSGRGGPGYKFQDEFVAGRRHSKAGILSMANAGPGTNGSQFFITHGPQPHLDDRHTVFGEVVDESDQHVIDRIQQGDQIYSVTISGDLSALYERTRDSREKWNEILSEKFSKLKPAS